MKINLFEVKAGDIATLRNGLKLPIKSLKPFLGSWFIHFKGIKDGEMYFYNGDLRMFHNNDFDIVEITKKPSLWQRIFTWRINK